MTKNVLITGASDGIGLHLSRLYSADGCDVVGVGSRSELELPADWPTGATYLQIDLSAGTASQQLDEALRKLGWRKIDVAIFNAGYGIVTDPLIETEANILKTLDVNLINLINCVSRMEPYFRAADTVASLALIGSVAHKGAANFATYAASKAGLDGFARALKEEWKGQINVMILHPGPTATRMHHKAGLKKSWLHSLFIDPEYVAAKIRQSIERNVSRKTISFSARGFDRVKSLVGLGPRT